MEDEVFLLHRLPMGRQTAIDAGANKGHYTYRLSKLFESVHAFEPNDSLTVRLREWGAPNVDVRSVALSDERAVMHLHVPVVDGVELVGWGSFDRGNLPGSTEFRTLEVETAPLDDFGFQNVSFIKIDVEGHEDRVLTGASGTLERDRPLLLVEVKEKNRRAVAGRLEALGYSCHTLRDGRVQEVEGGLGDYRGDRENFIFIPSMPSGKG